MSYMYCRTCRMVSESLIHVKWGTPKENAAMRELTAHFGHMSVKQQPV
jgi:hypothetical protein